MNPARSFVVTLGERLRKIAPGINADPRVNKSLFKIHRDTRFSKEKTPFKTNLGILFWEGDLPRMESSGFYFHVEGKKMMLATGIYMFQKAHLEAYRKSVADKKLGASLEKVLKNTTRDKKIEIGGKHYKRVPRGFDPDYKHARYLLHNRLYVYRNSPIPKEFYTPKLVDYSLEQFRKMAPLHRWLVDMTERM